MCGIQCNFSNPHGITGLKIDWCLNGIQWDLHMIIITDTTQHLVYSLQYMQSSTHFCCCNSQCTECKNRSALLAGAGAGAAPWWTQPACESSFTAAHSSSGPLRGPRGHPELERSDLPQTAGAQGHTLRLSHCHPTAQGWSITEEKKERKNTRTWALSGRDGHTQPDPFIQRICSRMMQTIHLSAFHTPPYLCWTMALEHQSQKQKPAALECTWWWYFRNYFAAFAPQEWTSELQVFVCVLACCICTSGPHFSISVCCSITP